MEENKERLYSRAEIAYAFTRWHERYLADSKSFDTAVEHVKTDPVSYGPEAADALINFMKL